MARVLQLVPVAIGTAAIAVVIHIGAIFAYPGRARDDAFARIAALGPVGAKIRLPPADRGPLPSRDPAMATAVCRYDLAGGPFRVAVAALDDGFLSFGLHSRHGTPFYGLNLRAGEGGAVDLVLMTEKQKAEAEGSDDDSVHHTLQIVAPDAQGFVLVDTPADGAGGGSVALDRVTCGASVAKPDPAG